jgi:hypothetical protein
VNFSTNYFEKAIKAREGTLYIKKRNFSELATQNYYLKTPLLVPGVGPYSNASSFELDQLIAQF